MKKTAAGILTVLSLAVTLILPTNSTLAATETTPTGKEIAKRVVLDTEEIKHLKSEEKQELIEFAKTKAEKVQKKIKQKAEESSAPEEQSKALEKVWPTLSEDEKLAYQIGSIQVSTVESPTNTIQTNAMPINTLANSSNAFTSYVTGQNLWGNWLWRYFVSNSWTYDGVQIRSINPSETATIYWAGWNYKGTSVLYSGYAYNNFDYNRNVEGHFETTVIQTWDSGAARFDTRIRANGNWTANGWVIF